MMNARFKRPEEIQNIPLRLFSGFLVVLILLAFIVYLYSSHTFYQATCRNGVSFATQTGSRAEAAVDQYRSALVFACYRLEQMINEDATNEELAEFLQEYSQCLREADGGVYEGIYGYFRGDYIDGDGWVPARDYNPTQRPWYESARSNKNQLAYCGSYFDAKTGDVIISYSRLLGDGESVVAVDIRVDEISHVFDGNTHFSEGYAILYDSKGTPVTIQNEALVTQEHAAELFACLKQQADEDSSEAQSASMMFKEDGVNSMAFFARTDHDWYTVIVVPHTSLFAESRQLLVLELTVIVLFLIILVIGWIVAYYMQKSSHEYYWKSNHDAMTGLYNKGKFEEDREKFEKLYSIGILYFDVNNLKLANDRLGHSIGDEVIQKAAQLIHKHTRAGECSYRMGGDEFMLVIPDCTQYQMEERLRVIRSDSAIELERMEDGMTCRVAVGGVTAYAPYALSDVLMQADEEMYRNKRRYKKTPVR